jgi:hypothetical protein
MKKLTFTLVLGILLLNVSAFGRMSELNIRLHNYAGFNIVFDNQVMNNNATNYDIRNIAAGNHYLKVIEIPAPVRGNRGYYNRAPRVLFSGNIYIGPNRKVYAMIDVYGRFVILSEVGFYDNSYYNNRDRRNNHDRNKEYGENRHDDRRNDNRNNQYGNNNYGNNNHGNNYYGAMSQTDFINLKYTIGNATFESTRLSIAKSAASMNKFTSEQVRDLLYLFTYESSKLDFAKLAYNSTIDRERFYIVYNAFTYSSSVDELSRYISRY